MPEAGRLRPCVPASGNSNAKRVDAHRAADAVRPGGFGTGLKGCHMRAHFTICPKWPAASDKVNHRGRFLKVKRGHTGAAYAVGLPLRRLTHGEPDDNAFHRARRGCSAAAAPPARPTARDIG